MKVHSTFSREKTQRGRGWQQNYGSQLVWHHKILIESNYWTGIRSCRASPFLHHLPAALVQLCHKYPVPRSRQPLGPQSNRWRSRGAGGRSNSPIWSATTRQQLGVQEAEQRLICSLPLGELRACCSLQTYLAELCHLLSLEWCCSRTARGNGFLTVIPFWMCWSVMFQGSWGSGREMRVTWEQLNSQNPRANAAFSAHTATSDKYFQPCNLSPWSSVRFSWKFKILLIKEKVK